jgi:Spy/CpxP family protein refolding chaperone
MEQKLAQFEKFIGETFMRILMTICASLVLMSAAVSAQTAPAAAKPLTDTDIQLLRSDVQADKNQIIADTMQFTDAESKAFWPIYRDFAHDQQVIGDDRVQLIKDYAKNYDSMDDPKARDLVQRMINIEDRTLNLREDYWPQFMKALGAKRAAKFYQVDNRLGLIVNLQLTALIPLIP